jgi:hypothetical protein
VRAHILGPPKKKFTTFNQLDSKIAFISVSVPKNDFERPLNAQNPHDPPLCPYLQDRRGNRRNQANSRASNRTL